MLFNSAEFLIFFPIAVIVYYLIPGRYRYIWLLAASYYFYMQWSPVYGLLLLSSTLITYFGALLIERYEDAKIRKICLTVAIVINLSVLAYFKYAGMFAGYAAKLASLFTHENVYWDLNIVLPVGISFFTLQALGYLIDVYRGDIYAEHNILRYALFISFFPQLVAGPIERSKNLLKQLAEPHKLDYENIRRGLLIMLYGFFLKLVIADRISMMVDAIYADPYTYSGFYIVAATFLFGIQIYCDFYGYSTIAKGAALVMGIRLMDNFNAPYLSRSISELWRRWHISLSTWFRDYLYIPLGGNRKGTVRKYINILIVFAVSGLWHGAAMSFVLWGLLHGVYQIAGVYFGKLKSFIAQKIGVPDKPVSFSSKFIATAITYTLTCIAYLCFRANSLDNLVILIKQIFSKGNWHILFDGSMHNIGFSEHLLPILLIAFALMIIVDVNKYKGRDVVESFFRQGWWFRMLAIVILTLFTLLFGHYGQGIDVVQFIYFQF